MSYTHILLHPELLSHEQPRFHETEQMCLELERIGFQTGKMDGSNSIHTSSSKILYIGNSLAHWQQANAEGNDFGLALWATSSVKHIFADFYFKTPADVSYTLSLHKDPLVLMPLVKWAAEIQFIAQAGITYSRDDFDRERFYRLRDISAEMLAAQSGTPVEVVKDIFCSETGFQTPKIDTRAAIFQEDKILLVQEKNGTWSLPGGWVDVMESIKSNTVKEVWEEAGLKVVPVRLIAAQDRNQHNLPVYAHGICKFFVLCEIIAGSFTENNETLSSGYFSMDNLPQLAEEKNNAAQIQLCFEAYHADFWETIFD